MHLCRGFPNYYKSRIYRNDDDSLIVTRYTHSSVIRWLSLLIAVDVNGEINWVTGSSVRYFVRKHSPFCIRALCRYMILLELLYMGLCRYLKTQTNEKCILGVLCYFRKARQRLLYNDSLPFALAGKSGKNHVASAAANDAKEKHVWK